MGPWYPNWGPKTRVTWRGLGGSQRKGKELASGPPSAPGHALTHLRVRIPRLREGGRDVTRSWADEVFAEHGGHP